MIDALHILRHYLTAKYRPEPASREVLARRQERAFQDFARKVLVSSPFYAPYVGRPLSEYPVVDKGVMVANFDLMNTRGLEARAVMDIAAESERSRDFSPMLGDVSVGLSSGTSGRRGLFAVSPQERQVYVGTALAKMLPGSLFRPQRIALLLRSNNTLYESAGSARRISYRFFDLVRPMADICRDLEDYRPTIIIGPPQALRLLADAKLAARLDIRPAKIISAAEVLDDLDSEVIAAAFEQKVHQVYQATEGFLGATCRHGRLHLNEDYLHFEPHWLDERRFMPIVTDFTRSTQPIVRYRLDDILVASKTACPCGSIHMSIDRIEGRFDDILMLRAHEGDRLVPVMPDFLRDAMGVLHGLVRDYRFIQEAPDRLAVRLTTSDPKASLAAVAERIGGVFERFGVKMPELVFAGEVQRAGLAKVRRVERAFNVKSEDIWHAS